MILALAVGMCLTSPALAEEGAIETLVAEHRLTLEQLLNQWKTESSSESFWDDEKLQSHSNRHEMVQLRELKRLKERDFEAYVRYLEADYLMDFWELEELEAQSVALREYRRTVRGAYEPVRARYEALQAKADAAGTAAYLSWAEAHEQAWEDFTAKLLALQKKE